MNWVRVLIVTGVACLSVNATAMPKQTKSIIGKLMSGSQIKRTEGKRKITPLCADFSGTWEGVCVEADGTREDSSIQIKQDGCREINVDGYDFPMGGLVTIASSSPEPFTFSGSITYNWNESQTRLYDLSSVLVDTWFGALWRSEMFLMDGKLRKRDLDAIKLNATPPDDGFNPVLTDCTYEKVAG